MTQHISEAVSAITGSAGREREVSNSTGTRRGATGSVVKSATVALPGIEELARMSDHEADKALVARLPPSVRFRPDYGLVTANLIPVGYEIRGPAEEARPILEASLKPADRATVERALTELALLTKAREADDQTEQMRAALYMARLSEYPGDAVIRACRDWADHSPWWPAWAELRERLEARVRTRRLMLDAAR